MELIASGLHPDTNGFYMLNKVRAHVHKSVEDVGRGAREGAPQRARACSLLSGVGWRAARPVPTGNTYSLTLTITYHANHVLYTFKSMNALSAISQFRTAERCAVSQKGKVMT